MKSHGISTLEFNNSKRKIPLSNQFFYSIHFNVTQGDKVEKSEEGR